MATIQKRLRFQATVRSDGAVIGTRSFGRESQARVWAGQRLEVAGAQPGQLEKEVSSAVRQRTSYRVMVRLRGYPAQYCTFKRLTDARRWGQETEAAIREGRHFKTSEAKRHTLGELVERYSSNVLSRKSGVKRRDQERHLAWWKEEIGSHSLIDVTPALISEKRDQLAASDTVRGQRSPATVNRYLGSLSHAFTIAVREWEWLERNPVRRVSRLKEPRGRVRFLSDAERRDLLSVCKESEDRRLYPLVVLALSTGARQGELLQLRWRDVDLARGAATVHDTKNGERRCLPVQGLASETLVEMRKVRRLGSDLLFAGSGGQAIFPREAWERALSESGITDFRFHDLRHSAASYLAMSGATLAEIAEVLGHKTLAMVKRYSHLTEQHTSGVVARMNERIFGSVS